MRSTAGQPAELSPAGPAANPPSLPVRPRAARTRSRTAPRRTRSASRARRCAGLLLLSELSSATQLGHAQRAQPQRMRDAPAAGRGAVRMPRRHRPRGITRRRLYAGGVGDGAHAWGTR